MITVFIVIIYPIFDRKSRDNVAHRPKVIHNGVCQYGAAGGRADVKQKNPPANGRGLVWRI